MMAVVDSKLLPDLLVFFEVARVGSISEAARRLHMVQTNVTVRIQKTGSRPRHSVVGPRSPRESLDGWRRGLGRRLRRVPRDGARQGRRHLRNPRQRLRQAAGLAPAPEGHDPVPGRRHPNPELKDVPFVDDLAQERRGQDGDRIVYAGQGIGRPFIAPRTCRRTREDGAGCL